MESNSFKLSCSQYEQYELWCMQKSKLQISYFNAQGNKVVFEGEIADIFSRNGTEMLKLGDGVLLAAKDVQRVILMQ